VLRKLPEVQREFIRTQHLHVAASSIAKLPDDAFVSAATADARFMVNFVCLFMKPHLLALQDNCLTCFVALSCEVFRMREEYNSVLSTPTEADKFGRFGRYRYIGKKTNIGRYFGRSLVITNALKLSLLKTSCTNKNATEPN